MEELLESLEKAAKVYEDVAGTLRTMKNKIENNPDMGEEDADRLIAAAMGEMIFCQTKLEKIFK